MGSCFEVYPIQAYERSVSEADLTPWELRDVVIGFADEDEIAKVFDPILKPYNLCPFEWFLRIETKLNRDNLGIPWAMIALDREYNLAGHFCSIRVDKTKMPFTCYSSQPGKRLDYPPISFILIFQKDALEETAAKSVFLKSAWEMLKDKDETRHWLCFMDPPPVEWVRQHEKNDKELYVRLLSKS